MRQNEKKRRRKKEIHTHKGERSFIARPTNKRAYAGTAWRTGRKKRLRESNESTFYWVLGGCVARCKNVPYKLINFEVSLARATARLGTHLRRCFYPDASRCRDFTLPRNNASFLLLNRAAETAYFTLWINKNGTVVSHKSSSEVSRVTT